MFDRIEVFRMAHALALHSSARQAEIAANVANADTPGYRAGDISPFAEVYGGDAGPGAMRATRAVHLAPGFDAPLSLTRTTSAQGASPNGNTVSLEAEMIKAVQVQQAHEAALSVYESARNILRTSLGRGR